MPHLGQNIKLIKRDPRAHFIPEKMHDNRRKGVKKEWGELVEAVEHETVLPDDDGAHEGAHAEDVVSLGLRQVSDMTAWQTDYLKPAHVIEKKRCL